MKLCINCEHYQPPSEANIKACTHPKNTGVSLVTGEKVYTNIPGVLRAMPGEAYEPQGEAMNCGQEGHWFEEKA